MGPYKEISNVRAVLDILKRNLFNIICAVVVVASLAIGGWGVSKMADVDTELKSVSALHGQFGKFRRAPANERTIQAEKTRVETVRRNYGRFLEAALAFNDYTPLEPPAGEAFFPTPSQTGKLEFSRIYMAAFDRLFDRLKAGAPPSAADVAQTQEEMDEEARAAKSFGEDEEPGTSDAAPAVRDGEAEEAYKSGRITTAQARESAAARASIRRARGVYCYADMSLFDINEDFARAGRFSVPPPIDMWKAQVSLWVQEDVVESLVRANETVAQRLKADGRPAWVGVLPVKEIISIRVSDYLPKDVRPGKRDVLGPEPVEPPSSSDGVFTQNKSEDLYDLVQFTLKMVVDPRDLPLIIDEVCKDRFHTLLNIEYAYETDALQTLDMEGRIYGSEPAVKILMDFETIFFGDRYRRLMPDAVLNEIGKERPAEESP